MLSCNFRKFPYQYLLCSFRFSLTCITVYLGILTYGLDRSEEFSHPIAIGRNDPCGFYWREIYDIYTLISSLLDT